MKTPKLIVIGLVGLVALLSGCASVSEHATNVFPEPASGKALIYFFREKKFSGALIAYNIKENGQVIGAVANGTYFFIQADPGVHTYTAATEAESSRTLTVAAGQTHYIECGVEMGMFAGRPALKVASEAEAKGVLPRLTYGTK